jgi:hypothetical protein
LLAAFSRRVAFAEERLQVRTHTCFAHTCVSSVLALFRCASQLIISNSNGRCSLFDFEMNDASVFAVTLTATVLGSELSSVPSLP